MFIVHVSVRVKEDRVAPFIEATKKNAAASRKEPGIARFDVVQQVDDPTRFVLVEVYRAQEDAIKHKETAHYAAWRDAVADMMAAPRSSEKFVEVTPSATGWDSP